MKYLKYLESRIIELNRVRNQFLSILNDPKHKSWWIKKDGLTFALFQTFIKEFGYEFKNHKNLNGSSYSSVREMPNLVSFRDKYSELFTNKTLDGWFKEWKEYELIKSK